MNGVGFRAGASSSQVAAISTLQTAAGASFICKMTVEMLRVWDALQTNILGTAANDDLELVTGTFLTSAPTVQTGNVSNTTATRKVGMLWEVPRSYVAASNITLRLNAGATDTAQVSMTIDVECANLSHSASTDICATAATTINAAAANKDFTLTGTNIEAGDLLYVVITIAVNDTGGAGSIGVINLGADGAGFRFSGLG